MGLPSAHRQGASPAPRICTFMELVWRRPPALGHERRLFVTNGRAGMPTIKDQIPELGEAMRGREPGAICRALSFCGLLLA